jgi:phosphatidylethanolamine/phosphatidyl-N-methylethanolamine N-methyltransferase
MGSQPQTLARIENAHVEAAYARWAPVYDFTFELVMRQGRQAAAAAASRPGGSVLDVGVGTGLELPMFASGTQLVGVDLSEPMLRRAASRVRRDNLRNVRGLLVMDAMRLAFADCSFDAVVAPYVLTVVPDPAATLDELLRVVKPGGEIVLVNHVGAERGLVAIVEAWLGRRSASLGWRPQFPWSIISEWIAGNEQARLLERRPIAPFGLFTLARILRAS